MDEAWRRTLDRAVRALCNGADAVCEDLQHHRGVPRLNYMTGGYSWDDAYVWDSWANFQWVGFLAGRLWLLHLLTGEQRYGDAAMQLCERIGPVLAGDGRHGPAAQFRVRSALGALHPGRFCPRTCACQR